LVKLSELRKEFSVLEGDERIFAVLLFGSHIGGRTHKKSDLDICVVAPNSDPKEVMQSIFRKVNLSKKNYDVYVFEELPLYLKMEIITKHKVVFARDKYKLYEYFYLYRKLWADQKHRNELKKAELSAML